MGTMFQCLQFLKPTNCKKAIFIWEILIYVSSVNYKIQDVKKQFNI